MDQNEGTPVTVKDNVTPMPAQPVEKFLSVEDIIAAEDETFAVISAWGGKVRIGSLDAGTLIEFIKENANPATKYTAGLRLIMKSLVDANGKRLVPKANQDRVIKDLEKKNAKEVTRVVNLITEMNGLGGSADDVDIAVQLRRAGNDPAKLKRLVDQLNDLATQITEAGTDEEKLKEVSLANSLRAEAKND